MNTQVRYYTKSGNTKKLADAIGEALGCTVATVDTPLTEAVDILFLGASVYKFGIDKAVLQYIDQLDPKTIGAVGIFSTSAMSDSGTAKLTKKLESKGIQVFPHHFYCKGKFMMANKGRPNQADVDGVKQFAKSVTQG